MKYREIGRSGVQVSEIGFGVWTITAGWWGKFTEDEAIDMLHRAADRGITFFDTGDTYGDGVGETVLAKAFRGQRDRIVIGTKFGYDWYNDRSDRPGHRERSQDYSPEFLRFAIEQSLKRLETDYIDVYQLHNPRMEAILRDDLFAELERLRDQGKIRAYGAALGPAIVGTEHGDQAMRARPEMSCIHIIYNMLEQQPGRRFIAPARELGIGLLVRVPHSSGMLEGTYTLETTFSEDDHRSHRSRDWLVTGLQKIEHLKFLHEGRGSTLAQAALKWLLAEPAVPSVLPNIYNLQQLEEFSAASDMPDLSQDDLKRVAELYDRNFYLEPATA
jgi:aryl-alcohol dehydrogenase-like predicted oxidoreductase